MARTVGFSVFQSGTVIASGTLSVDDNNFVTDISGTADGQPITGLSTYNGADNRVIITPDSFRTAHYSASEAGLSFTTAGFSYNLSGAGSFSRAGIPYQENDTLTRSDGVARTASFGSNFPYQNTTICFVTGTRIRTARGEVAVEDLRVGDQVVTVLGALRPVIWIGHRDLAGPDGRLPHDHQPVRIRAGAFGPELPARDLALSPGHPVLVGAEGDGDGGVLVPIMCLINGTTIAREPRASVTYWHVELDVHDILLAEGLPAESYLDWGDRAFFDEASDHALHNPDFVVPGLGARCRPVAVDGPIVDAERRRLDAVFAAELTAHAAWEGSGGFGWLAS